MSDAIEFTGRLFNEVGGGPFVLVQVRLRGKDVGSLGLGLSDWDQLRADVQRIDRLGWLTCESHETRKKGKR